MALLDGKGWIAVPSFTDAHAHLDSTRLGMPFRPHTAGPGLEGLITNDLENWRSAEDDVTTRATRTLGLTIARGATLVRSHAQVDTRSGLDRLEGVLSARETHRARADVRVVAFPQAGIVRDPGTGSLLDAALDLGADAVGGIDPCALDRDPRSHLDVVFGLAERRGVPVDIHLHEPGDLGAFTLELICERTRALDLGGRVTVSHAFVLASVDARRRAELLHQLAALDIAVTTIAPSGNRSVPVTELAAAGVRLGLGQDGMRDYWSPFGDADMLSRTWQLAFTQQLRRDDDIERCLAVATVGGRAVVRPSSHGSAWTEPADALPGFHVGEPGDLVLLPGESVTSAIMDRPTERVVIHSGSVVSTDGSLVD
jgi:cytosine/adenosine deaminase-related metal-dependent hydrolase